MAKKQDQKEPGILSTIEFVRRNWRKDVKQVPTDALETLEIGDNDILGSGGNVYRPVDSEISVPDGPLVEPLPQESPTPVVSSQPVIGVVVPTSGTSSKFDEAPTKSEYGPVVTVERPKNNYWFILTLAFFFLGLGICLTVIFQKFCHN